MYIYIYLYIYIPIYQHVAGSRPWMVNSQTRIWDTGLRAGVSRRSTTRWLLFSSVILYIISHIYIYIYMYNIHIYMGYDIYNTYNIYVVYIVYYI